MFIYGCTKKTVRFYTLNFAEEIRPKMYIFGTTPENNFHVKA